MARKLNKKFVAAAVVTATVGAGGVGALWYLKHPSVANLEARGDKAWAANDYKMAVNYYGRAAQHAGNDIPLQVKLIDAYEYVVQGDREMYRNLRQIMAAALSNDPRSVPVLQRMIVHERNDVHANPADNASVRLLAENAGRLVQLDPNDADAKKALIASVLEPYLRGLDVPAADVAKQQQAAEQLWNDKADSEALQMLVRFHFVNAQHAGQQGDLKTMKDELAATKTLVDAAVKKKPQDGLVWFADYAAYRQMVGMQFDPANRATMIKQFTDALAKANEFTKPSDGDDFLTIRATALHQLELVNNKQAEAGYRKLLDELPDDRQPRIMLADFLARQPARRDEAAKVLETPWKPQHTLRSLDSIQQHNNEWVERVRLCTIKLGAIEVVTDPADKQKRLAEVEKQYAALTGDPDINQYFKPALLRIKGGIDLENGRLSDAISTLDDALKQLDANSPSSFEQQTRNEVLLQYAQVQLRLGQTGKARPALAELITRQPENLGARVALANVLIAEHSFDEASKQVNVLKQLLPDNPAIQRMQVQLLAQRSDELRDKYKDMPEQTRDQRAIKLQAAGTLGETDEVIRLAKLMIDTDPADVEAVNLLSQIYLRQNKRADAVNLVHAALAKKPDDARLKSLNDALAATTPEEQQKLVTERVDQIADPYERAITQAQLLQQQNKPDEALKTLKAAVPLKPDDGRALDMQFSIDLATKRWADAEALLDPLGKLNVDQTGGSTRRIQLTVAKALDETDPAKRNDLFKDALAKAADLAHQYNELAATSLLYAQMLQQTGDLNDAVEQYGQTLDKSPTNLDAIRGIASCLMSLNRGTEARARLDDGEKLAPNDPGLNQLEMAYQLTFGDPQKAIAGLEDALKQNPNNPQAYAQLAAAYEQVANAKLKSGDVNAQKEAAASLQKMAGVYEAAYQAFPGQLQFATALAEAKRRLGDPTAAEQIFVKLAADPKYKDKPEIVEALSEQYARSGKIDEAERVLKEFLARTKPASVSTVLRLSWLLAQQQRLNDAMAVLDLRRDDPDIQRQRIQLFINANDLAQAHAAVDEAIAQHPTPDLYLSAAYLAIRDQKFDQAGGFINRVLAARPNDPAALFYRAQVKLNQTPPDLDGARDDLIKTRDAAPNNVEARLALADVYTRKREPDSALVELQKAWAANRDSKLALMRLADAYTRAVPPAWSGVQKAVDEAKQSPQLANDPDVLFLEADTAAARNDPLKAKASAKQALATAPNDPRLKQRYFDLLLRAKAYSDLLSESKPIIASDNSAWWLYRLRGIADVQLQQKADAEKDLGSAFNIAVATGDPAAVDLVARTIAEQIDIKTALQKLQTLADSSPDARLTMAQLDQVDNNPKAALDETLKVLADRSKLRPDSLRRALQLNGTSYLQVTPPDPKKALDSFQELLKLMPNDPLVLNNVAYALTLPGSGGTAADALQYSQKAYNMVANSGINDQVLYVWDTHGWVLIKNNHVEEGLDLLRKAADLAKFPDVFAHLAEGYLIQNNLDAAEVALSDAKRRIADNDRRKQPVDPAIRAKVAELSATLTKKRTEAAAN